MLRASWRRFKRLLVGSAGPRRRCKRRRKSCVRIRNGSAFSARDSMRQTAGRGGRAAKKSSSRVVSKSWPQSSSSTKTGYNGTGKPTADSRSQPTVRRQRGEIFGGWRPSPAFSVSVASAGFSVPESRLDATLAGGFITVAFRGVRKAEGTSRGSLVESCGAHPRCDGNSAEAHEKEGVAGAPACRVCRVGAGFR